MISKELINKYVQITDVAEEFGIRLESISSGEFDFKCKCPAKDHKGGSERTSSLCISTKQNSFYCFGCNASGGAVNFYMICSDSDFQTAIEILTPSVPSEATFLPQRKQSNIDILISISNMFRQSMLENKNDIKWISSLMEKVDKKIDNMKFDDIDSANRLKVSVENVLKQRYSE